MLRCWWVLTAALLFVANASSQFAAPYIADYWIEVNLHRNATMTVTETITVNFGSVLRHGIYRKIPFRYQRQIKGIPTTYNIRIKLLSVTDERGNPYPVKVWREGGYWFWRIGDPDRYVSGVKVYRITYSVARAINSFSDHDELYWNATGNEWEWDITRVHCLVNLPEGVDASKVKATFYTGYFGSKEQKGRMWREGNRWHFVTGHLRQGEGLTIVIGLPKGVLQQPSPIQSAFWFLADNWALLLAAVLPLFTFGLMFWRYWNYGRDPIWRESIVVQYQPPDNLSPAEVGVLVDERADNIDIVATIIDLAVRGYLKIREIETEHLLFFKRTDYEFIFLRDDSSGLKEHERDVWDGLRVRTSLSNPLKPVRLSELKGHFHFYLGLAKSSLYRSLTNKGYFAEDPSMVRTKYFAIGAAVGSAAFGLGIYGASSLFISPVACLSLILSGILTGIIIAAFAPAMPRKTVKGARALWHIIGFREFIQRVEKDRLERMLQEDPNLFDRVLPYALVFGIADEWAAKFEGLLQKPPDWYVSDRWTPTTFNSRVFIASLGDSISSMNSALPYLPSRSGAGEGISGFGGGGFSGGGFGGGGGGGW
jgi:uncharacterized membrane protein